MGRDLSKTRRKILFADKKTSKGGEMSAERLGRRLGKRLFQRHVRKSTTGRRAHSHIAFVAV